MLKACNKHMRLQDFPEDDGKRVWLDRGEVDLLISKAKDARQRVAFALGARAGLRRDEIVSVTPGDFFQAPPGWLRIWEDYSKGGKYRETPIPETLAARVDGMERPDDEPVVDVAGHTVYRWVKKAAEACAAETGDRRGWRHLTPHDLRRSWGAHLLWDCGVLPAVVMSFGGWEDWKTFRDHYLGEMSPAAADRERAKVFGETEPEAPVFEPTVDLTPAREYAHG